MSRLDTWTVFTSGAAQKMNIVLTLKKARTQIKRLGGTHTRNTNEAENTE
jgi:hypothetical protein